MYGFYLRPVATFAYLLVNKIRLTSLQVCDSINTLIEGVAILVIYVQAIGLSGAEIASRNSSCGSFGSGRGSSCRGGVWIGMGCGDGWCGFRSGWYII